MQIIKYIIKEGLWNKSYVQHKYKILFGNIHFYYKMSVFRLQHVIQYNIIVFGLDLLPKKRET